MEPPPIHWQCPWRVSSMLHRLAYSAAVHAQTGAQGLIGIRAPASAGEAVQKAAAASRSVLIFVIALILLGRSGRNLNCRAHHAPQPRRGASSRRRAAILDWRRDRRSIGGAAPWR